MSTPLSTAVLALQQHELVVFPTETVYGIGARADSAPAIAKLVAAKQRPDTQPITLHLGPSLSPHPYAEWSQTAERLSARYWPGALTLILPKKPKVTPEAAGYGDTIGLRVPDHPVAIALLAGCGVAVAATSANRHGDLSPTAPAHLSATIRNAAKVVLEAGECALGIESTVLSLVGTPTLFRLGSIDHQELEDLVGAHLPLPSNAKPIRQASTIHLITGPTPYSLPVETMIVGGPKPTSHPHWHPMPPTPRAYGATLFATLHTLRDVAHVAIVLPPDTPPWAAIRARLLRLGAA